MKSLEDSLFVYEHQIEPIPTAELERRWKAVREGMSEKNIDVLITVNNSHNYGYYIPWFLGIFPHGYQSTVIFPLEGEMTVVAHMPIDMRFLRGVKEVLVAPQVPMFRSAWDADALKAVEALIKLRPENVGIVGLATMPAAYFQHLVKTFSNLIVDESTDLIDELRAVKSDVELRLILKTAAMNELSMEVASKAIRPGRKVYEVMADIRHSIHMEGQSSDLNAYLAGCSAPGEGIAFGGLPLWNKTVRKGEIFSFMNEAAGPGGYYLEHTRQFSVGESPKPKFENLVEEIVDIQNMMADKYRPDADPNEILEFARQVYNEKNFPEGETSRLIGHSQGLDYVERPALTPYGESLKLKANMVMACHPGTSMYGYFAHISDDYLVTENGGKRIHSTPQEILIAE